MPANRSKPVYAPYIEHVPPDGENGGGCCGPVSKENLNDLIPIHPDNIGNKDWVILLEAGTIRPV